MNPGTLPTPTPPSLLSRAALGLLALFGGAFFLTAYLLIVSYQAKGNMQEVLLGKARAST